MIKKIKIKKNCFIPYCCELYYAKGYCKTHWEQIRRLGKTIDEIRKKEFEDNYKNYLEKIEKEKEVEKKINFIKENLMPTLTNREKIILESRIKGYSYGEIANIFKVNRERIRQIFFNTFRKIRKQINIDDFEDFI